MFQATTGELLCTTEQMLLHVDTAAERTAPMTGPVLDALTAVMAAHKALPAPEQKGRVMDVPAKAS